MSTDQPKRPWQSKRNRLAAKERLEARGDRDSRLLHQVRSSAAREAARAPAACEQAHVADGAPRPLLLSLSPLRVQVRTALTRELKKVHVFELQKTVRRARQLREKRAADAAAGADAGAAAGDAADAELPADERKLAHRIEALKRFEPADALPLALRTLGVAHTGPDFDPASAVGSAAAVAHAKRLLAHRRVAALLDALDDKVTERRRERLAEASGEAAPPRKKQKTAAAPAAAEPPAARHDVRRAIFVESLSGEGLDAPAADDGDGYDDDDFEFEDA